MWCDGKQGQFVVEYIGELITRELAQRREKVCEFRSRNGTMVRLTGDQPYNQRQAGWISPIAIRSAVVLAFTRKREVSIVASRV